MAPEHSPPPSQHKEPLRLLPGLVPADLPIQVSQQFSIPGAIVERANAKEPPKACITWNRSLPINQLPSELLLSIFVFVANALPIEEPHPNLNQYYPKWTRIIKVCHHWRDVAYASPTLWRTIVMHSAWYTRRALAMSTPATIDAIFMYRDSILQVLNIQLLRPHAHRLRLLSFRVIQKSWLSAAFSLLQGDAGMPALETLEFPLGEVEENPRDDDFEDVQFTSERFPCLRFLTVTLTTVPLDVQVYARLRKLSLTTCRGTSFHRFLDALAASTNLERLELISTLQRIQGDWAEEAVVPGELVNPISLRHLKSLSLIYDPPVYTSRFLSHILLSPTVSVRIIGDPEDVDERAVTETLSAMLPPNPSLRIMPTLALVTDVSIRVSDTKCILVGHIPAVPLPPLTPYPINFHVHAADDEEEDLLHRAARDLPAVFNSALLASLRLEGPCGTITLETWTALFSKFPLLETLALVNTGRRGGTNEKVFAGLMAAAVTVPAGSPVPCPGLRRIRFSGDFAEAALDVTLRCLEDRAEKGHRLEELTLSLESHGREGDDVLFETRYLPRLKELVADIRCECVCYP